MRDIEFTNDDLTRAIVTCESSASHWWRRRYVIAEVAMDGDDMLRAWHFVVGGDAVYDHDPHLSQAIGDARCRILEDRKRQAGRAKLRNPWVEAGELPPAKVVKR